MTTRLHDDKLDAAVRRLLIGEPTGDILAAFPQEADELRPLLQAATMFKTIQAVETPPVESLAADRNEFLTQLTALQLQPVSPNPIGRLKGWISQKVSWSSTTSSQQQKEMRNMSAIILKAALVLTFAFGSLGGTLAAAANSLPDSAVYPIKLFMEQARLTLEQDPAEEAGMHLAYAQERVREMVRQAAKGDVPEEALRNRLQNHMREAYYLATQASDQEMNALLVQAIQVTQAEQKNLERAQEQIQAREGKPAPEQTQLQSQQQIQSRLKEASQIMNRWQQQAEYGLQEPLAFRLRFGQNRIGQETSPAGIDPNGEPAQEQNRIGQPDQSLGPGQPGGSPDCPNEYEPAGDKHQHGPGSEGPATGPGNGPGGPGGNPDCQGDCEPEGDQNRYGQESEDPPGSPSNGPGEPCGNPDCPGGCDNDPNQDQQQEQNQERNTEQNSAGQNGPSSGSQAGDNSPGAGEPGGNPDAGGGPENTGDSGAGEPGGNPDSGGGSSNSGDSGNSDDSGSSNGSGSGGSSGSG